MLEVLYHHAKFGAQISPAAVTATNVEFFVCLFVTLSWLRLLPRSSLGGASVRLPFISFNNRSTYLYVISYNCYLAK